MLKGFVSGEEKDIKRIAMKGKQLFDISEATSGKYIDTNGQEQTSQTGLTSHSGYIPITSGEQYTLSVKKPEYSNFNAAINWFTGSKTFISRNTAHLDTPAGVYSLTATAPNNAAFAIVNYFTYEIAGDIYCMFNTGSTPLPYEPYGMQPGWEVRDQQGTIIWGADKTLTGTDSISFKGYGLPLKSYEIEANMEQAASQQYSISGTDSVTYQSDGTSIALQIVGNAVQNGTPSPGPANPNLADPSKTVPGYQESNGSIHSPSAAEEITTDFIPFTTTLYILISGSANGDMNYAAYNANKQIIGIYNTGFTPNTVITADPQNYTGAAYLRASWTHGADQPICITTTQTSTFIPFDPDPPGPVIPEECGERTGNLFDKSQTTGIVAGKYINQAGSISTNQYYYMSYPIKLTIGETYTWSFGTGTLTHSDPTVGFYDSGDNLLSVVSHNNSIAHFSFTVPQGCAYIRASVYKREQDYPFNPMLISGTVQEADNIPIPWYEPYGYKIPITNGNTTYNVYLTEPLRKIGDYGDTVSSDGTVTRNIGVYVFTGAEIDLKIQGLITATTAIQAPTTLSDYKRKPFLCSHMPVTDSSSGSATHGFYGQNLTLCFALSLGLDTLDKVQTYLASEYAAGHPVEVWYVLATPVSDTATFPTITPTQGSNTLSVNTTLAPSAITLTATSGVWPKNPIEPEEFGDLVTTGEHAGQYKIPITNGNTTYNIYLSEPLRKIGDYGDTVASDGTVTRQIKKLVLTGNESYSSYTYATTNGVQVSNALETIYRRQNGLCTIYPISTQAGTTYCLWIGSGGGDRNLYFISILNAMGLSTADDFKSYVATQYANGTPVCVWYVLATAQTESITAPTIATIDGSNTLAIGTSLAPSETTITGHIKPIST